MAGSDFSKLQTQLDALAKQVAANTTLEGSAADLLNGQAAAINAAVTKALQDDDAADQGSIAAATAAIQQANAAFVDSAAKLGAAVVANTPPAPPPPNPVG